MRMNIKRVIECGWVVIEGRARKIFHWQIEVEIWLSRKWRICQIMSSSQPNANVAWICTIYKYQHIHFFFGPENSEGPRGPWKASAASLLQRRVWNTMMKPVDAEAWVSTLLLWLTPWWCGMLSNDSELQLSVCIRKCGSVIKKSIHVHVYEPVINPEPDRW